MAFTQLDLENIRLAIASGELTVQFSDRRVTYRSMDELLKAEARIVESLQQGTGKRRPRQLRVNVSKGI
ncbi:hypothetical protein CAI21_22015 [Alkalilimnicola ehrlichii]|uniref:Uncharacterized protein n=1 Tax=Alkalilimnicola ehrlichii TaxID=351052 RepID=A0A3E0WQ92_9GAMM|nr:hypothetical protein [Alkalilimnicola ehrlichii]RFA24353.1 hypothetical protein CAI21_22015 [Alkalilimnicola ehrlichii]RFA35140.1 hypothetical protein CAL65_13625 [Alkalilimnicola ehrlichii]